MWHLHGSHRLNMKLQFWGIVNQLSPRPSQLDLTDGSRSHEGFSEPHPISLSLSPPPIFLFHLVLIPIFYFSYPYTWHCEAESLFLYSFGPSRSFSTFVLSSPDWRQSYASMNIIQTVTKGPGACFIQPVLCSFPLASQRFPHFFPLKFHET